MKKIIDFGIYWKTYDLDINSPIIENGYRVLFDDNSEEFFKDDSFFTKYQKANSEEIKSFRLQRGYITIGDKVIIYKGRKMVNEIKEIESFFKYIVPNTYGHEYVNYVVFTDGTKVNIRNIKPINCKDNIYCFKFTGFNLSGKI